jgi:Dolichyl-phosphate-mannose-protein mannosyltransferase
MPASSLARRIAYLVATLAPAWAVITIVADGVAARVGPLRISSTEPVRPLVVGVMCAAWYLWRHSETQRDADAAWLGMGVRRIVMVATPALVVIGGVIAVLYGTFVAAGSDAYGYVSQAALWRHGDLIVEQPIVQQVSWPESAWTFTPLGYRPVSENGGIAPTYPPGLPILMAAFQSLFGEKGAYFVVPALASVALACTYLLGRTATGSRHVGALSALLLLASPVFLAHTMVPMSDVPVTAAWSLACLLALRDPPRPLLSGLAAGAALLIRPNLLLLAAAPMLAWLFACGGPRANWRPALGKMRFFCAGLAPGVFAIAALNAAIHGSPFESAHGRLSDIYDVTVAPQNFRNYATWFLATQSPLASIALIPLFAPGALRSCTNHASARACLIALPLLVFCSYVFYGPFDNWTYLRFLLPAYPAIFVLMAAGVRYICLKLPLPARLSAALLLVTASVALSVQFARNEFIFNWREHEQRYVRAAARASEITPPSAILFSSQHSGSLRYYADRMTLRYDALPKGHLDSAIRELNAMGRPSFLVIDEWEREDFRKRFTIDSRAGALDWAPAARVVGQPDVFIYELTDRAK